VCTCSSAVGGPRCPPALLLLPWFLLSTSTDVCV
jgi:hypothetical protein